MQSINLSEAAERLKPLLNALPTEDRLGLASYLWESVETSGNSTAEEVRAAWKTEIARRLDEIRNGTVTPIPVEEMFRKSREKHP
jgi:putative addiction module component (TIGR02574 family)